MYGTTHSGLDPPVSVSNLENASETWPQVILIETAPKWDALR